MTVAAIIELGPADHAPPDVDAMPRAEWRWVPWVALVTALLVLAGSAPLPPPPLGPGRIVRNEIADRMVVLGDRIYAVGTTSSDRRLSAYALPSGRPLWTVSFVAEGQVRQVLRAGGVLLMSMLVPGAAYGELLAFDLRHGRPVWRTGTGFVYAVDPGHALVIRREFATDALYLPARRVATEVAATDPGTGEVRWSHVIPPGARYEPVFVADELRWTVLVPSGSATAEVRYVDTGAVVASGRIAPAGATLLDVRAVGQTLLVRYGVTGASQPRIAAYEAGTLTPLWTIDASIRSFEPADCGPAVCLSAAGIVSALDRRTGAQLWRAPLANMMIADGRLLSVSGDGGLAIISPETGQVLYRAASWRPLGPAGPGRWLVIRSVTGAPTAWVGVLDLDRPSIRTLGLAEGIVKDTCRLAAGCVVCDLVGGGAGAWPYRA